MLSSDYPRLCTKCQGYMTMPYAWNSTMPPRMCSCQKVSLSWECTRCRKINAPWKGSCDCTPSNLNWTPTSESSYVGGINASTFNLSDPQGPRPSSHDLNKNFPDPNRNINQDHADLNKNFTDK